jgi:hypothetical protein
MQTHLDWFSGFLPKLFGQKEVHILNYKRPCHLFDSGSQNHQAQPVLECLLPLDTHSIVLLFISLIHTFDQNPRTFHVLSPHPQCPPNALHW